jgi:hypothetical protein
MVPVPTLEKVTVPVPAPYLGLEMQIFLLKSCNFY